MVPFGKERCEAMRGEAMRRAALRGEAQRHTFFT